MGRAPFDTMKFPTQLLLPVLAATAACGSSGTATTSQDEIDPGSQAFSTPGDAEILGMVYDNDYSVPDGFYVDEERVREHGVAEADAGRAAGNLLEEGEDRSAGVFRAREGELEVAQPAHPTELTR